MTNTPKYGLNKPEGSDYAKIQLLNENADKLDAALDGLETRKEALLKNAPPKTTPIDADAVVITDSASSNATKRIIWANIIASIKSALNSVYAAAGHTHTAAQVGAIPATEKGTAGGVATLGSDGMVPVSQLPSQVKERRVVDTITARNAIADKFTGLSVYVKDATADPTVSTGGADYLWDGAAWIKTGEAESLDVVQRWANVQDKPSSFPPSSHAATHKTSGSDALTAADVGAAASSHTHAPGDLTGTMPVSSGGTGSASFTAGSVLTGNGTAALAPVTPEVLAAKMGFVYGTCATAAATTAKTATAANFVLNTGAMVSIKFTYANTAASPTLNVNSTGAKPIYHCETGTYITSGDIVAGMTAYLVYNGTQWVLMNPAVIGVAKIATGTYTGTGSNGSANKNTLTFDFVPRILIVKGPTSRADGGFPWLNGALSGWSYVDLGASSVGGSSVALTWSGNTVSWYHTSSALEQLNVSATVYSYIAIG